MRYLEYTVTKSGINDQSELLGQFRELDRVPEFAERRFDWILHGPSMFAVKAKFYGMLYKQSNSLLMKYLVIG